MPLPVDRSNLKMESCNRAVVQSCSFNFNFYLNLSLFLPPNPPRGA